MSEARNLKAWAALLMAALAASVLMAMVLAGPAWAATLTVTTTADEQNTNGLCSLREAITNANQNDQSGSADCPAGVGEDTIDFQPSLSPATITLGSQQLTIADSAELIIDGGSADITVSGNNAVRVFEIGSGAKLTLNNLTVANGSAAGGASILNQGTLTVTNSTLSGNNTSSDTNYSGGGIWNPGGTLTVTNSTLSGNSANGAGGYNGGGIVSFGPSTTFQNTIVANSPSGGDCYGTINEGGHNLDSDGSCGFDTANNSLSGVDPMLGDLADNGGPTKTHALLEGSPAIDKGDPFGATTDQRGVARPQGAASDIGAFEFESTVIEPTDADGDGVPDNADNCKDAANADQADADGDGIGDACDTTDDTTAPRVSAVTPTGTGIGRGTNVVATFSEEMDPTSITKSTFKLFKVTSSGTTQVTNTTVTLSSDGLKATLNPFGTSTTLLTRNTKYKAVVTTRAEDLAGNALDQNSTRAGNQQRTWTFTTG